MNDKIISMLNEQIEETVIIYHLHDHYNLTLLEARNKLIEVKKWGAWYAHKSKKIGFEN